MKKIKLNSRQKRIVTMGIWVLVIGTTCFFIGRQVGLNTDISNTRTITNDVSVEQRTLSKTLTASGEVASSLSENLDISTSLYFNKLMVENGDSVTKGEKILMYTDGTYLIAPYDLVITAVDLPTTGSRFSDDNYITVSKTSDLLMDININENEISSVSVGQSVKITLSADSTKTYDGTVKSIGAMGNYSSSGSTFEVKVSFENDGEAKLGMSASCEITLETIENAISVPVDAVLTDGDERYVNKVTNGQVEKNIVETGISDGDYVEVTNGLNDGDTVRVTTEITESTIRNTGDNSDSFGNFNMKDINMDNFENMPDGFEKPSNMPDNVNSGGSMPNMPSGSGGHSNE